ncbi:MAG: hypothetical protein ACJ764_09055 [Solirubrobacteraceae bacterium]
MLHLRQNHIDRIDSSIETLEQRASRLLEREEETAREVRLLQRACDEAHGWVRAMTARRALRRRRARLGALQARRRALVDGQIRSIMFALQQESQRTRDELDRQLERLAPIEEQWERLRSTFDALEAALRNPAFVSLAEHWQGQLEIPEFPVARRDGYAKPFPQHALLF